MSSQQAEPIAIVGSACRFAGGSNSPSSLWELLRNPRDVLKEIPKERFDVQCYYHPNGAHHGTTNVRHSYMLDEDLRLFDAKFFNLSKNEANSMDPQQRILMEVVYESMEAAGVTIDGLKGSDTAVYVGAMGVDYQDILMRDVDTLPTYCATGISRCIISNRISYFFDWHGPSMTIDTACSSSMVAVHQGVQALRSGSSRMAIACGSELILGPEIYVSESKMNLLSPTGRSRMWDVDVDGYARGDGLAAVVMKKLSDAIADGDHIECVIRETGINQDGRGTGGLTVPSSEAQAALIRQTYARAGLNIANPHDRPQFFEAHGSGTKVGDPVEAAAIQECFGNRAATEEPLYVGSIKTIVGHTEGAAGIAGLLKGSLALQHGTVPPNLLFNRLNPSIEPFYDGLHVPTEARPWPKVSEGCPRRVSVNSFGFGGTNGHAILESYEPAKVPNRVSHHTAPPFIPFTFSAGSEASLVAILQNYSEFLKSHDSIDLRDLAWTLQSRRSALPIKRTFSATNVHRLVSKIDEKLAELKKTPGTSVGVRSSPGRPRVLGVFTGQGAQWAMMGARLIASSAFVRERIKHLENSLSTLPESDRPSWKIEEELLREPVASRIGEAELSQPLCTIIQIVLVDMLRSAGLTFVAVAGHSSGEIAAAYAADFISAHNAVRIAYYRGFHAKLARGRDGQHKGAMLAVGLSWADAKELSERPAFQGRITLAAHNSAASVTMSGDMDAIMLAKSVLDEKKQFARLLKVQAAYHSHHMLPCSDPYLESLRACKIRVNRERESSCSWYSSVDGGKVMSPVDEIQDTYWVENMAKPVMFMEAITNAAREDVNLVLEVGPHPALKGPATQSISDVRVSLPYSSVLSRGDDDVEAFSDCLGFIWMQFGGDAVNFDSFNMTLTSASESPKLLTGLPRYQWDHQQAYWHESRRSKKVRNRSEPFHELLGVKSPDSTGRDWRWTNLLKANEIPWLSGHKLQGQTVFPAAGYVAMALEAAKKLARGKEVKLFEVSNLVISKAITFEEDAGFAVETLITLTAISSSYQSQETQTADFICYSCSNVGSGDLELMASACVKVIFGDSLPTTLTSTRLEVSSMSTIGRDRFYSSLLDLGYGYTASFGRLSSLKRKLDQASAIVSTYCYEEADDVLMVHPTTLDVAFQALLLAQSAPGDQGLWSLHIPTSIRRILVNPSFCTSLPISGTNLPVDAVLQESESIAICGNVDIFSEDGQQTFIQVEGLTLVPFSPATVEDDRRLFSYTKWDVAEPNGAEIVGIDHPSAEEVELSVLCERLSYYYLRKWMSEITDEEWINGKWHHQRLQESMNHLLSVVASGRHPCVKKEWQNDTEDQVKELISKWYARSIDLRLISAVGENMPDVVRGKTTVLEHMLKDNMLNDLYRKGIGFAKYNSYLAKMVKQVAHRYPRMKILEIGAGTGGATKSVLESLNGNFSSYTYTDISTGFFEKASTLFKAYNRKMIFKVFDVEKAPGQQGYEEYSYDMIIASNVLHATKTMQNTLENTRRLLKPGGYLMLFELTNNGPIRIANMTAGLSGWWVGVGDGRRYAPTISATSWNSLLHKTGFSGVDAITPERDAVAWPFSIMATKAVNDQVNFLRKPLWVSSLSTTIGELVILGNGSLDTSRIAEDVAGLLRRYCSKVIILENLPTGDDKIAPMSTFVNLVDIDEPIFKNITAKKMDGLKRLFELSRNVLWITKGARVEEPYNMSSIGFGRAISHEIPHIRLQFLDLPNLEDNVSRVIAESVLRLHFAGDLAGDMQANLLWTQEPELVLEKGQLLVPRILPNEEQNSRLNSFRRPVTKIVDPHTSAVQISQDSDIAFVIREEAQQISPTRSNLIHISHSVLSALSIARMAFLFLGIGTTRETNNTMITLSRSNSSIVVPSADMYVDIPMDQRVQFLSAIAAELLATCLVAEIPRNSTLLVHEPGQYQFFDLALTRRAADKGIRVIFSTISSDVDAAAWINIRPWASERQIKMKLPATTTHFLDLRVSGEAKVTGSRILQALPPGCKRISTSTLFRGQSLLLEDHDIALSQALEDAVIHAKTNVSGKALKMTRLSHINDPAIAKGPITIVDWRADNTVAVKVQPLNAEHLFSSNKTYLLVGLTGHIGQSICEWMVRNGAGTICLTSRRPNISSDWLKSFEGSGADVKVFAMDITDKQDLRRVYDEIKGKLPPIAGVANAAMVLHDTPFSEMSLEMMEKVLKPKIDGTNYLDEIFYDTDLDFFVLFSSLSSVVGNSGQSNYAAAGAYLTAMATRRRRRGLAASAFDISRVVGIGYVDREGQVVHDQLTKYGYMPISESDLHQMFAETIRAGRPNMDSPPVVTTGIRSVRDDEDIKVPWFDNPRFSHLIVEANVEEFKRDGQKAALPTRVRLKTAADQEEALRILEECFAAKIQAILQLSAEQVDHEVPLVQLGIDSLVAVEVRSWFLEELQMDMPVLKVLGGGSIIDLCQQALDKLPEKLVPIIGPGKSKVVFDTASKEPTTQGTSNQNGKPLELKIAKPSTKVNTVVPALETAVPGDSSSQSPSSTGPSSTQLSSQPSFADFAEVKIINKVNNKIMAVEQM